MNGGNYETYKILFNTFKNYNYINSPYLSHLNSTFSASPVFHEVLTKHYNVQETVRVLKRNHL